MNMCNKQVYLKKRLWKLSSSGDVCIVLQWQIVVYDNTVEIWTNYPGISRPIHILDLSHAGRHTQTTQTTIHVINEALLEPYNIMYVSFVDDIRNPGEYKSFISSFN